MEDIMDKIKTSESVQFTFRIPVDLKAELEQIAQAEDRSLSKQIIYALRQHVRNSNSSK